MKDLLDLTLKLNLSLQFKSQFENHIKKLVEKNKELTSELEITRESLRITEKDIKGMHEVLITSQNTIENLEFTLKSNQKIIDQNRSEQ